MTNPIGYVDRTWNPITGCTPVSLACDHCYAARMSKRLAGRYGYPADEPFRVTFHEDRLDEPLHWKKPSRVFVCSMGDLFHEDVDFNWVADLFDVMRSARQHTFLVLTKRPERMQAFVSSVLDCWDLPQNRPAPNVWLGVTVENQWAADTRIPDLLETPAFLRFVSCEPLLGTVDLRHYLRAQADPPFWTAKELFAPGLDWVIAGGETGPGARPMHPKWAQSLRDQCTAASVPFFFKQWGVARVNSKDHLLDGVEHREFPS